VIAIAGGSEKVRAILGALRGGYIKTLITDITTARAVLVEDSQRR
jgi:DNA-binding transcriptional regulator LsrR (DeoR family)